MWVLGVEKHGVDNIKKWQNIGVLKNFVLEKSFDFRFRVRFSVDGPGIGLENRVMIIPKLTPIQHAILKLVSSGPATYEAIMEYIFGIDGYRRRPNDLTAEVLDLVDMGFFHMNITDSGVRCPNCRAVRVYRLSPDGESALSDLDAFAGRMIGVNRSVSNTKRDRTAESDAEFRSGPISSAIMDQTLKGAVVPESRPKIETAPVEYTEVKLTGVVKNKDGMFVRNPALPPGPSRGEIFDSYCPITVIMNLRRRIKELGIEQQFTADDLGLEFVPCASIENDPKIKFP